MSNIKSSSNAPSTPTFSLETPGRTAIKGFGSPHVIKSATTKLGKQSEIKARYILTSLGFDCIDVGEGFEFDLIATGVGFSSRVQVKTIGPNGATPLTRNSQSVKAGYSAKSYGFDAFDHLFLIDRDSLSGYLIPASEIIKGGRMKSNVRAHHYPAYHITTK